MSFLSLSSANRSLFSPKLHTKKKSHNMLWVPLHLYGCCILCTCMLLNYNYLYMHASVWLKKWCLDIITRQFVRINDFTDCSCNTHSAISDRSLVDVFKSWGRTGSFTFSCLDSDWFSALLRFTEIFLTAFLCWGKTGRPKVLAKLKSLLRFLVYTWKVLMYIYIKYHRNGINSSWHPVVLVIV